MVRKAATRRHAILATGRHRVRGFSLLELLVVIAVIALTASALPWALDRWIPGQRMQAAGNEIATILRNARLTAMSAGQFNELAFSAVNDELLVSRGSQVMHTIAIPGLSLRPATPNQRTTDALAVRFGPDGSSTGLDLLLQTPKKSLHVRVMTLTGRVSVSPP